MQWSEWELIKRELHQLRSDIMSAIDDAVAALQAKETEEHDALATALADLQAAVAAAVAAQGSPASLAAIQQVTNELADNITALHAADPGPQPAPPPPTS